jgi:hypothetical protein
MKPDDVQTETEDVDARPSRNAEEAFISDGGLNHEIKARDSKSTTKTKE